MYTVTSLFELFHEHTCWRDWHSMTTIIPHGFEQNAQRTRAKNDKLTHRSQEYKNGERQSRKKKIRLWDFTEMVPFWKAQIYHKVFSTKNTVWFCFQKPKHNLATHTNTIFFEKQKHKKCHKCLKTKQTPQCSREKAQMQLKNTQRYQNM